MIDPSKSSSLTLPLIGADPTPLWNDLAPVDPLPSGEYNPDQRESPLSVPIVEGEPSTHPVELLSPAGGPDAAFAAFHFGADAIYLGLKKFSARVEAENFTLDELDEVTAYAHSLNRRVFVTINTLIRQDELPELVDAIAALADIGVDALIIQDFGVYHLVRRHFPSLELHASTQLAVHNRHGAETLRDLGFTRVVLARELTFEEVRDITHESKVETEVFIHGALCYSYSGLCLFSSQTTGRSGNRGKCSYSCRDSFDVTGAPLELRDGTEVKRDPRAGFPFSMKDLALPDHIPALRAAGVSCFKIEGRKKSPLYVATTTDYYRRLIDGTLDEADRPDIEADLQTVFSRPWTRLFMQSNRDKEVADRDTVGHRGTRIGSIEAVAKIQGDTVVRFRTDRELQKHDGLQIDLPGRPFGFPVDRLWLLKNGRRIESIEVDENTLVEVALPDEYTHVPVGAAVYCSSSQVVKQRYRHSRPKPGAFRGRLVTNFEIVLSESELQLTASADGVSVTKSFAGPFDSASNPDAMANAIRTTFEKLGDTRFLLGECKFLNPAKRFVQVSKLNAMRREIIAMLDDAIEQSHTVKLEAVREQVLTFPPLPAPTPTRPLWSIKVDRIAMLDALENEDIADVQEVIIDIARDHPAILNQKLDEWSNRIGRDRIRLALPALTRGWEEKGVQHKLRSLRERGWSKWEAGNASAWSYLGLNPTQPIPDGIDIACDWSVYVINRLAAQQVFAMGATHFTLSPEDGVANVRSLLAEFGTKARLIVHQDTPLFLAESCAYANLIGGCPGKANCKFESMEMENRHGEKVLAIDYHCRTIVLNSGPFCLASRLSALKLGDVSVRADFVYRKYEPTEVRDRWRLLRSGQDVAGGHAANFDRGLL